MSKCTNGTTAEAINLANRTVHDSLHVLHNLRLKTKYIAESKLRGHVTLDEHLQELKFSIHLFITILIQQFAWSKKNDSFKGL